MEVDEEGAWKRVIGSRVFAYIVSFGIFLLVFFFFLFFWVINEWVWFGSSGWLEVVDWDKGEGGD